ncbi:MAG: hypothetical protein RBS46_08130 [Methyloversatilis sp.]|nr:hypothetical protein [Methyloversatilis sp.]
MRNSVPGQLAGSAHEVDQRLESGLMTQDPLKLGLMVDDCCRAIDARGRGVEGLYYVGPLLRAQFWEATAIPELRRHAAVAVDSLLGGGR